MDILGLVNAPVCFATLLVALLLFYRYLKKKQDREPWLIVGNALANKKGFIECNEEWFNKYGRVFGIFDGFHPLLVVGDADMLREITVKEFNSFPNRRSFGLTKLVDPPTSEFLTLLEDDKWRHNRNTLTPAFSGGKLKKMTNLIVDTGKSFVEVLEAKADSGEPLDMKQQMEGYTMDVIAKTAFGIKLDSQNTPNDPFVKYARKFFDFSFSSIIFILLLFFPVLTPLIKIFKIQLSAKDSMAFFTKVVQQALLERRKTPGKHSDFLQLMVNAQKEAEAAAKFDKNDGFHVNETVGDSCGDDGQWKDKRKGQGLSDSEIVAASILFSRRVMIRQPTL